MNSAGKFFSAKIARFFALAFTQEAIPESRSMHNHTHVFKGFPMLNVSSGEIKTDLQIWNNLLSQINGWLGHASETNKNRLLAAFAEPEKLIYFPVPISPCFALPLRQS